IRRQMDFVRREFEEAVEAFVFFFQAEDGIRYRNVTGVQTCALPIFSRGLGSKVSTCDGPPGMKRKITRLARAGKCGRRGASGLRSEERRVGKEGRVRAWGREDE